MTTTPPPDTTVFTGDTVTTSLPRWTGTPPAVDDTSSEQMVVTCDGGDPTTTTWISDLRDRGIEPLQVRVRAARPGAPVLVDDDRGLTGLVPLRRMLDAATVGLRLLVAGEEWQVMTVISSALQAGLLHPEIRGFATERGLSGDNVPLIVFCVHCEAELLSPGGRPGGTVTCPGCCRLLEILPHVNGSRARYLAADATAGALT
jgi:hypothetical protein